MTPALGYFAWWRDEPSSHFVFIRERWFGPTTDAGGADKASHIFADWASQHLLENGYRGVGRTGPRPACCPPHGPGSGTWASRSA